MQKFIEDGSECQSLCLNNSEALLNSSNASARKCATEFKAAAPASSIESVFTTTCFTAIIADITTNLAHIEPQACDCLKKHSIPFKVEGAHQIFTISTDSTIEAVKNLIRQSA